jgi:hypothetical protein
MPDMISLEAARRHYEERLVEVEAKRMTRAAVPAARKPATQLLIRFGEWFITIGTGLKLYAVQSTRKARQLARQQE